MLPQIVHNLSPAGLHRTVKSDRRAAVVQGATRYIRPRQVLPRIAARKQPTRAPLSQEILGVIDGDRRHTYRTFDRATGAVVEHRNELRRSPTRMIERLYNRLWEDEAEVRTIANAVLAMNAGERTKAAIRCVNRKYQREMETSVRRGMASPAEIHERLSVLMAQEIEDLLMGFGEHTEGISRFRLRNAATDQLLYEKAEKLVRAELQHFYKNMILPTLRPDITKHRLAYLQHRAERTVAIKYNHSSWDLHRTRGPLTVPT